MQFKALVFKFIVFMFLLVFAGGVNLFAHAPNDSIYVQSLYKNSKVFYTQSNYTKAIESLQEILKLKKKQGIDAEPQYFKIYNRLGLNYYEKGQLSKAIKYYRLALEHTSVDFNKTIISGNIANVYSLIGEYSKAVSFLENSLPILEKSNFPGRMIEIADNYHNQGYAYYQSGQYKLALQKSLKGMQIAKENNLMIDGTTYGNCGLIYKDLDSLNKADFYFKKSIEAYENEYGKSHYMTAMAYLSHAVFYAETGEFEKSERLLEKSGRILIKSLGLKHYYTALYFKYKGDFCFLKNQYHEALEYYQQALSSRVQGFNSTCLYENPAKGIYPDLDLLDILNAKAKAFVKLANKENKKKNLTAALQTLQLSVAFIEQLRTGYLYQNSKLQLAATEHESYLAIVEVAYALFEITGNKRHAQTCFKYADLSKYSVLREVKNDEQAKKMANIPGSIVRKEEELKQSLSRLEMQLYNERRAKNPNTKKLFTWNKDMIELGKKLEAFIQKIEKDYPGYYHQKYSIKTAGIYDLQKHIPEKDALIAYTLTQNQLFTFVVSKDTFLLQKQHTDSSFYVYLNNYKKVLHTPYATSYKAFKESSFFLYQKLILPIEKYIANKSLVIVPANSMGQIAFEALVSSPYAGTKNADYRTEPYILRKYPISYSYLSTFYLNSLNQKIGKTARFFAIAPGYKNSKDSLMHIPSSIKNARKLALLTLGKALTGKKATKSNFMKMANKYDIIHFYAHGFEDTLNPNYSKICFTPGKDSTDNGALHAWEIYNMKLNANLVVLASCYSGSGNVIQGEGVMSMGRSFYNAGSSSIVISLWTAFYKSSILIQNSFYINLLKGKTKAEALRIAKLKYLDDCISYNSPPRYWANFVVIGNKEALYENYFLKRIFSIAFVLLVLVLLIRYRKKLKFF